MESENKYVMCIISAPEEIAEELANRIVQSRYAASAQVTGKIKSFYWWGGKMNINPEMLIFLKTLSVKIPFIRTLLKDHHPYEVPEFIVLPLIDGNPDYFNWIDETVN